MVDVLRAGTKAAEAVLAGVAGGAAYSTAMDPLDLVNLGKIGAFILVAMVGYIFTRWYYEWRRGEPLD